MPRKKKKSLKWLVTDNSMVKHVMDLLRTLPWKQFDKHSRCSLKDDCFFCCVRSLSQRLSSTKGPKAVEPHEIIRHIADFQVNTNVNNVFQNIFTKIIQYTDFQQFFVLNLSCTSCKNEWSAMDTEFGLCVDNDENLKDLSSVIVKELYRFECPSCLKKGPCISQKQFLLPIYFDKVQLLSFPFDLIIENGSLLELFYLQKVSTDEYRACFRDEDSMCYINAINGETNILNEAGQIGIELCLLVNRNHMRGQHSAESQYSRNELYELSSKAKQRKRTYESTATGKNTRKTYESTATGKNTRETYENSNRGKKRKILYNNSNAAKNKRMMARDNDLLRNFETDTGFNTICVCCNEYKSSNSCSNITNRNGEELLSPAQKQYYLVDANYNKSVDGNHYICTSCRKQIQNDRIPTRSDRDLIDYYTFPVDILENGHLNKLETFLFKNPIPFIRVANCKMGMYLKLHGNLVLISSDLKHSTDKILPHKQELIPVSLKRKLAFSGYYLEEWVDVEKVRNYFQWFKKNNPFFEKLELDETRIIEFEKETMNSVQEYIDFQNHSNTVPSRNNEKSNSSKQRTDDDGTGTEATEDTDESSLQFKDTVMCNKYMEDIKKKQCSKPLCQHSY